MRMDRNKGPKGVSRLLYSGSENLNPRLREIVLRIAAKQSAEFTTSIAVNPETQAECSREAWCNPLTGLWTVEEHRKDYAAEEENGVVPSHVTQQVLLENVCFFDALYACAAFEVTEQRFGGQFIAPKEDGAPHFRVAAAVEGIPFDTAGLPHPAAFGRILTPGTFTEDQRRIAQANKGRELEEMPELLKPDPKSVFSVTGAAPAPAADAGGHTVHKIDKRETRLTGQFRSAVEKAEKLRERFQNGMNSEFSRFDSEAEFAYAFGTLLSAGLAPGLMLATGVCMPNRKFAQHAGKFDRELAKLPECDFKNALAQFGAEARFAYSFLRARAAFRDAVNNQGSHKRYEKHLQAVRDLASQRRMTEIEIDAMCHLLRNDIGSKRLEYDIARALETRLGDLRKHLAAMEGNMLRTGFALPAPHEVKTLPPPKPQLPQLPSPGS
jgi:hypothetical protein